MNWITVLGLLAGFMTTLALLPQVIKTWRTRSAADLSLGTFSLMTTGVLLWLIYGIILRDIPLIAANAVTLFLAASLLLMTWHGHRTTKPHRANP